MPSLGRGREIEPWIPALPSGSGMLSGPGEEHIRPVTGLSGILPAEVDLDALDIVPTSSREVVLNSHSESRLGMGAGRVDSGLPVIDADEGDDTDDVIETTEHERSRFSGITSAILKGASFVSEKWSKMAELSEARREELEDELAAQQVNFVDPGLVSGRRGLTLQGAGSILPLGVNALNERRHVLEDVREMPGMDLPSGMAFPAPSVPVFLPPNPAGRYPDVYGQDEQEASRRRFLGVDRFFLNAYVFAGIWQANSVPAVSELPAGDLDDESPENRNRGWGMAIAAGAVGVLTIGLAANNNDSGLDTVPDAAGSTVTTNWWDQVVPEATTPSILSVPTTISIAEATVPATISIAEATVPATSTTVFLPDSIASRPNVTFAPGVTPFSERAELEPVTIPETTFVDTTVFVDTTLVPEASMPSDTAPAPETSALESFVVVIDGIELDCAADFYELQQGLWPARVYEACGKEYSEVFPMNPPLTGDQLSNLPPGTKIGLNAPITHPRPQAAPTSTTIAARPTPVVTTTVPAAPVTTAPAPAPTPPPITEAPTTTVI